MSSKTQTEIVDKAERYCPRSLIKSTHMNKMMRQCRHSGVCDVLPYKDCFDLLLAWWSPSDIKYRAEIGEQMHTTHYFFYPITKRVFEDTDMERMREEGYSETLNMEQTELKQMIH